MGMKFKTFRVTCLNCKGFDDLKITDRNEVFYTNHVPIISARLRGDMTWGFECQCGNDSRIAVSEVGAIDKLVRGGKHAVDAIKEGLKIPDEKKFKMELLS